MLQEPSLKVKETSINNDSLDTEKHPLTLKAKKSSENKQGSDTNISLSKRVISNTEEDLSNNKKSAFGKVSKGSDKFIIDFNKKEVNLHNSEDQQALIQILKKEVRNKKEIQFIDRAVNQLKFFADKKIQLNEKLYGKLLDKLKYQYLEKEKPLFYHGDKGDKYYIVLKGCLILLIPPKPFEESAPIDELYQQKLKEKYFRMKDHPENFYHRNTITSTGPCEDEQVPRSPNLNSSGRNKAQTLSRYVNTALKFTFNNNNLRPQTPTIQSPLNTGSSPQSRKQSQRFKSDFEQEVNNIDNTFDLYCQAFFPNCKNAFTFNAGAGFGEIALMRKTERSGTVISKEDCHLITLDKDSFDEILGRWEREKTDEQLNFLKSFAFFREVNEKYLLGLLHSMKQVTMIRNEIVYREDESPENVYFIRDGEVELSKICSIQKTETIQQQLEKEEIDSLIRGNAAAESQKKHINQQNEGQQSKKNKQEQKLPVEQTKKEKKSNEGTRVKFSVISQPCYFGDEEILIEFPTRNHMAKILSTSAELWVIDKKSFQQLLKQQRTFKIFQDQCKAQINLRNKRLDKISTTIKKEEDKFLINTYKPKHSILKQVQQDQSLIQLLKSTEEDNYHFHHNKTQDENENNINQLNSHYNTYNQFFNSKEGQHYITNENIKVDEKNYENGNQQKLLSYYSRNNYLDQLAQVSSKKMQILKEISQKGIGFNGTQSNSQALQSSLAEFDEDLTTTIIKSKHSIPYQKNLLFQPNFGNGIRRSVFRDPFQTYDDQAPQTSKGLKSTQSATNLLVSSDTKRSTLHNLYATPRSNAIIKPILERFEREQIKSGQSSHREQFLKKLKEPKKNETEDSTLSRHKARNSLRVIQPQHFNSIQSSITQITEFNDDPKSKFIPLSKNSNPNLSSDSLNLADKPKSKYHNIQELIQESKQQLQSISEVDQVDSTNKKKKLVKMRSDIQFENDYLINKIPEPKPKSHQNSANIVSIQLLHENDEEIGSQSSFIQPKCLKPSIHSLAALTPNSRNNLKPLGERQQKFEFNEKLEQISTNNNVGKVSRSSFQEQFNNQKHKKIISTLNLNASENAFDSFKILLTEDTEYDENLAVYSPSNACATSPSHQFKSGQLNSFRNTSSNIHMEKLRKMNQPKHLGSTPFINNFNKMKNSIHKKFVKENQTTVTEGGFMDTFDQQNQFMNNAFRTKSGVNHMFKKAYQAKK